MQGEKDEEKKGGKARRQTDTRDLERCCRTDLLLRMEKPWYQEKLRRHRGKEKELGSGKEGMENINKEIKK
jgi:hypothetical protein